MIPCYNKNIWNNTKCRRFTKTSQACRQPNTKDYGFGQTDSMGQFADGVGHFFWIDVTAKIV